MGHEYKILKAELAADAQEKAAELASGGAQKAAAAAGDDGGGGAEGETPTHALRLRQKGRKGIEGCQIEGRLKVKRIPGNFHINFVHDEMDYHNSLINATHNIHYLIFSDTPMHKPLSDAEVKLHNMFSNIEGTQHRLASSNTLHDTGFVSNHEDRTCAAPPPRAVVFFLLALAAAYPCHKKPAPLWLSQTGPWLVQVRALYPDRADVPAPDQHHRLPLHRLVRRARGLRALPFGQVQLPDLADDGDHLGEDDAALPFPDQRLRADWRALHGVLDGEWDAGRRRPKVQMNAVMHLLYKHRCLHSHSPEGVGTRHLLGHSALSSD